jgi:O-antigen/teichoic acid export membrane protein
MSDSTRPLPNALRTSLGRLTGQMVGSGACALADQAVVSAANFVSGVIVGRTCVKDEFGAYMLGLNIVLFLMAIQHSLILTPYMVHAPHLAERARRRYTGSVLLQQLGMCLCGVAVFSLMTLGMRWAPDSDELTPVMLAISGGVSFLLLKEHARGICFAQLRMTVVLILDVIAGITQVAALLVLARLGLLSAGAACAMMGVASFLAVAGWFWWMRGRFTFRLRAIWIDARWNWVFGRWVLASNLVWSLTTYLYPWLLVVFHDVGDGGTWAACLGIVGLINPVLLGIQNFVGPNVAHAYAAGGRPALRRRALQACGISAVILAPVLPILFLFGDQLVALVYGAKYSDQHLVVGLLGVNLFIGGLGFAFSRALFAMERATWDLAGNLTGLLVLMLTGVWLAKGFGPLGIACGMLSCTIASTAVRIVAFACLSGPGQATDVAPARRFAMPRPHRAAQRATASSLSDETGTEGIVS